MRLSLGVATAGSCTGVALASCELMFDAAANGDVALVEHFLAQRCDTARGASGFRAALAAVAYGHVDVLGALLRSGDAVNQVTNVITLLISAAQTGRGDVVGLLIAYGAAVDQALDDYWTPLLLAAFHGHTGVVDVLIAAGANVNKAAPDGATPLFHASREDHTGIFALLVAHGAAVDQKTKEGSTPLLVAASRGNAGVCDALVAAGANLSKAAPNGATPLLFAAQEGHAGVVNLFIAMGANVDNAWADATPLYAAAHNGHSDIVEMLIESGADVDKATADGTTPLDVAAHYGHSVVEMLIKKRRKCEQGGAERGDAAAICLAGGGHAGVVDLLIATGANMNDAAADGTTPLCAAAQNGHRNVVAIFIEIGGDLNKASVEGATPLYGAAQNGHPAVVEMLIECGADLNRLTHNGETPAFTAAMADAAYLDLVRDAGADQAVRRNGAPSKPRSTTTKRRREKTKPGSSRTLSNEPPADDTDEAAMHIDESSQAGDAASFSVDEVKTETCDDEHARLVEAPPPPDDFDDATTVALLESLGLGSLLAVFREHEIDDSALLYLEPGDMRDMDIPLASALKILSAAVLDGATQHQAVLEAELHEHRAELARLKVAQRDVDEDMMCPISSELMKDPGISRDGNTYERVCIEQWRVDVALDNEALSSLDVVPNIFARKKIAEFLDKCRRAPAFR
ncbi:ankyrin repeat-containing domain protein [Pelagophyceae sp. CCMP2097]|nr:ankyrin repeat-containing domain protein [Pelagophyceae sp. CCMP2097]